MCETMNEAMPDALMVLCHFDGRIATVDQSAMLWLGNGEKSDLKGGTISQIAAKAGCAELIPIFERFAAGEQPQATSVADCGSDQWQVSLRRLNGFQSQPLIAIALSPVAR